MIPARSRTQNSARFPGATLPESGLFAKVTSSKTPAECNRDRPLSAPHASILRLIREDPDGRSRKDFIAESPWAEGSIDAALKNLTRRSLIRKRPNGLYEAID